MDNLKWTKKIGQLHKRQIKNGQSEKDTIKMGNLKNTNKMDIAKGQNKNIDGFIFHLKNLNMSIDFAQFTSQILIKLKV